MLPRARLATVKTMFPDPSVTSGSRVRGGGVLVQTPNAG